MRKLKSKIFLEMLEKRGLSVNAFSIRSGIPQGTLSHLVSGDRNVGPKVLAKICEALRCEQGDISEWYEKIDQTQIDALRSQDDELLGYFHRLKPDQKKQVLIMVEGLAKANMAEAELKHGI